MDWVIQPLDGFNALDPIVFSECPRAFSTTHCRVYAECNGTATLIVQV